MHSPATAAGAGSTECGLVIAPLSNLMRLRSLRGLHNQGVHHCLRAERHWAVWWTGEEATGCLTLAALTQWITNEMRALSTQAIKRAQREPNDSHKRQFNQMLYSCLEWTRPQSTDQISPSCIFHLVQRDLHSPGLLKARFPHQPGYTPWKAILSRWPESAPKSAQWGWTKGNSR